MNTAIIIGDRFHGIGGALVCVLGQLALLVIVTSLGSLYERYASVPEVVAALTGAAAAVLVLGTGLKVAWNIKPKPRAIVVSALAFCTVGLLHWPLVPVVAVLAPISIAAAALEATS